MTNSLGDDYTVFMKPEKTNEKCPECKKPLVIKIGKFGKFIRSKQTLITIIMIGAGLLMRMMH